MIPEGLSKVAQGYTDYLNGRPNAYGVFVWRTELLALCELALRETRNTPEERRERLDDLWDRERIPEAMGG